MHEDMDNDFFGVFHRFKKIISKVKFFEVSHGEFFMLGAIYGGQVGKNFNKKSDSGIKISELNRMLKGSKSATSKMLRNLEEKGYIVRNFDEKDKRNILIKLTDVGEQKFLIAKEEIHTMTETIFHRMGDKDMAQLMDLCNKMCFIVEDEVIKYNQKEREIMK